MMKLPRQSIRVALLALGLGVAVAGLSKLGEAADPANRYPYDPACAWGRIANGRGLIVRCLSQAESSELFRRSGPPAVPSVAGAGSAPLLLDGGVDSTAPKPTGTIDVKVARVSSDSGKLVGADKKLSAAGDRFLDCVTRNGGLEAQKAEVHVRFLVRARGRAEGVSVSKRSGVSSAAAQCVADVVDRRQVGVPDGPMVGATVVIQFRTR